jgi:hypothetical protein
VRGACLHRRLRKRRPLPHRPIPVQAVHPGVPEPIARAHDRAPQLALPLRNGVAKSSHQPSQAEPAQRRIGLNDNVHERVDPRLAGGLNPSKSRRRHSTGDRVQRTRGFRRPGPRRAASRGSACLRAGRS